MEYMYEQFRAWWTNRKVRDARNKVGLAGGLLLFGWISGTLLAGVLNQPPDLTAAVNSESPGAVSATLDRQQNPGFSDVAKLVRPAVVHITVVRGGEGPPKDLSELMPDFFKGPIPPGNFKSPPARGMGSGVIISPDGYLVTNHHVVDQSETVNVTLLDKREFKGQVVGSDPKTDLAIVKIDGENLPYLEWGDSSKLEVGDYVLAVGHPFGLTATVTQGIVSALGRGGMGITQYEDFIQTDAAINPGNSGGALVNAKGELIGINTAILSRTGGYQGVGFAVPSEMAMPVFVGIKEDGKVTRGFLGVGIQEVTPDLATSFKLDESKGALVSEVKSGSPADRAGIKRGDVIVKFEDQTIENPRSLQKEVLKTPVGTSVSITVVRESNPLELEAFISEQEKPLQVATSQKDMEEEGLVGLRVEPVNGQTARTYGIGDDANGVVVTAVAPGSRAEQAGLARGDIIQEVNQQKIQSMEDYRIAVKALKKDQLALIFVNRSGVPLFLTVKV